MQTLIETVKLFPKESGVYLMKNSHGTILYIGKAHNLRMRVLSYFNTRIEIKTSALMQKVARIEYILTASDYEALLLECNLIKQWRPHYNIELKDGKSYPVVRITNEQYPRIFKTHTIVKDGSRYYGPYVNTRNINQLLDILTHLFPLRKCRGNIVQRAHPCLYFHIGRCAAPCASQITPAMYLRHVQQIEQILQGETAAIKQTIHLKIAALIKTHAFEQASAYRDALNAISTIEEEQQIVTLSAESVDYIGHAINHSNALITIFQTREGRLIGSQDFHVKVHAALADQMEQIIVQFYEYIPHKPKQIIVATAGKWEAVTRFLNTEKKFNTTVRAAQSKQEQTFLNLVMHNAESQLVSSAVGAVNNEALEELQQILQLGAMPSHIEGFDVAHIGGTHTVAAMVYFKNGKRIPSEYRKYQLRSVQGKIDDFESLRETAARRYTRVLNERLPLPDLILVDGGIGQVNAVWEILRTLKLADIPLVGIAKKNEELFVPHNSAAIIAPHNSPALRLLQEVRDEAHRFATTFRASKQRRALQQTILQSITGISSRREALLLKQFGTIENIRNATAQQVASVTKMSDAQAQAALQELRKRTQSSE